MNAILHRDDNASGVWKATRRFGNVLALLQVPSGNLKCLALGIGSLFVLSSVQAVLTTVTYTPNPVDLNDLDHHSLYTWRIDNIPNATILSATLNISNIANWDANANKLYMHMLDTAIFPGVASFIDDLTGSSPVTDIKDDFTSTRFHNDQLNLRGPWLVANNTGDTTLPSAQFTLTPTNYNYAITGAKLNTLNTYRVSGNDVAFGFDPDCHYFNDGISFTITYDLPAASVVPEVSAFAPLAGILGLAIGVQRRRSRVQVLVAA